MKSTLLMGKIRILDVLSTEKKLEYLLESEEDEGADVSKFPTLGEIADCFIDWLGQGEGWYKFQVSTEGSYGGYGPNYLLYSDDDGKIRARFKISPTLYPQYNKLIIFAENFDERLHNATAYTLRQFLDENVKNAFCSDC